RHTGKRRRGDNTSACRERSLKTTVDVMPASMRLHRLARQGDSLAGLKAISSDLRGCGRAATRATRPGPAAGAGGRGYLQPDAEDTQGEVVGLLARDVETLAV